MDHFCLLICVNVLTYDVTSLDDELLRVARECVQSMSKVDTSCNGETFNRGSKLFKV